MNIWNLRRFSAAAKKNRVVKMIGDMQKNKVFKNARFDVYLPGFEPKRVVVLLGQIHTFWKGKIANRERNLIVGCQARLCSYYAYFERMHNLRSFGGEGLYDGLRTDFADKRCFELYEKIRRTLVADNHVLAPKEIPDISAKILMELAKRWHDEVRAQKNIEKIQLFASSVSGQTLFNFLTPSDIQVFPVEGEGEYQHVLRGIQDLGKKIATLEQRYEFRAVKQRGNKIKSEKEAAVILEYNSYVKEFNRVIGSDVRERATLEILKRKVKRKELVVFTMGVGHRKNYLGLMDEYFRGGDTAFVFVTAPELLPNLWVKIGVPVLALVGLLGVFWWLG